MPPFEVTYELPAGRQFGLPPEAIFRLSSEWQYTMPVARRRAFRKRRDGARNVAIWDWRAGLSCASTTSEPA